MLKMMHFCSLCILGDKLGFSSTETAPIPLRWSLKPPAFLLPASVDPAVSPNHPVGTHQSPLQPPQSLYSTAMAQRNTVCKKPLGHRSWKYHLMVPFWSHLHQAPDTAYGRFAIPLYSRSSFLENVTPLQSTLPLHGVTLLTHLMSLLLTQVLI